MVLHRFLTPATKDISCPSGVRQRPSTVPNYDSEKTVELIGRLVQCIISLGSAPRRPSAIPWQCRLPQPQVSASRPRLPDGRLS